ncbi:hypothetical protein CLU79DRAFT_763685 [Phycomyces nitens]|nr:hypothetical protein CLU79DRAFT_763685 [Phycomyces nitens]
MSSSLLANVVQQFSQPQDQPVQQSKSDLLLNAAAFAGTEALLKNHEEENNEKPRFWRDAGLAGAIAYGIYKYKDHQANKQQQQQQLQWQQQQQYMQQLQQQQQQQQQAAQYQQQIVQRQQIYSQYSPYYNYTQPYNVQYAYQRPHYYPQQHVHQPPPQYLTAPHTYGHIQPPHSQYTYQTPYYQYNYPQQSTPGYFDRLGGQPYYQPYTPYGQPATFGQPPTFIQPTTPFIQPQTYGQPAAYIQPGYRYPYY